MQIQALENALNMYRLDNSDYPSTEQGLKALVEKPVAGNVPRNWREGGYLDKPRCRKTPGTTITATSAPGEESERLRSVLVRSGRPAGGEGKDGGYRKLGTRDGRPELGRSLSWS